MREKLFKAKAKDNGEWVEGYYAQPGDFNLGLYTTQWFRVRKHFCSECKEKFLNKLNDFLLECGFEKER